MGDARPASLLGQLAIRMGLVNEDQLAEVTRTQAQEGSGTSIGELMVQRGLIDRAQLRKLLEVQKQVIAKQRAKQAIQRADAVPEVARPERPAPAASPAAASKAAPARGPARAPAPRATQAPAAKPAPRAGAAVGGEAAALAELLREGVARKASDVHIHAGVPLRFRLHGRFVARDETPIPPERARALILSALTSEQQALLAERGQLDFAYSLDGVGRFRVNAFRAQRGHDAVFRFVPPDPPTLEDLGLPTTLARLTNYHQGMVLVTGPANCGKSATLAALVGILNEERRDHILTIEDPIEYVHGSRRCVVNQRSVGPHTDSFARALRAALREDPDVIVIGELRDFETVSLALTAAETGHLVLGTLHTNGAIRTINRIVGVFPADQQEQVRSMVSESLRAVVSQRLVPTLDGAGRAAALEILMVNKAVGNLIRENKTFQIHSQLQTGASQGMCLLDDSLNRLVKEKVVSKEEALRHCEDPKKIPG